jgi:hypothetical protein
MSDYDLLTAAEQDTYDEYTRLRQLSDWPGFDADQQQRKDEAGRWISDRRAELQDLMRTDPAHNAEYHRQRRYEYLGTTSSGKPHKLCQLPTSDQLTDGESAYISEREVWWRIDTDYVEQEARKQLNWDWLVSQRKYVWRCAEGEIEGVDPGWTINNRQPRYEMLEIATKHGTAYTDWCETHNPTTGEPLEPEAPPSSGWRDKSEKWHESHLGITESPADSNCDSRDDGIRHAQDTCANGTWLRYQPWCGVWAFMGLYQSGKVAKGTDSWMASVASIEDYAKAGRGPFRGWTTDGSKAKTGDLVVLFGRGQHVGTIRSVDSTHAHTWEGNTSSGSSGSQSNGGGSFKRSRSRSSETYGYALVRD